MKRLRILAAALVFLGGAFAAVANPDEYYKEGQRLFAEQDFAGALEQFEMTDEIVPNDAMLTSWIGACLNALGRYAEAKERMETAFELLDLIQSQAVEAGEPPPPIEVGYYSLLAGIQVNLGEFQQAVQTMNSYEPIEGESAEETAEAKEAAAIAKKSVYAQLVSAGAKCLREDDPDCARTAFGQADILVPEPPSVFESVTTDALARAARAPGTTDEEKSKKAELYADAVDASRLWLSAAAESTDAKRSLVRALMGTRTEEAYNEAIRILTSLWEGTVDPSRRDGSIQVDLAGAYTGLEQWDLVVSAASTAIESGADDPLGEGYCKRSYAQYRLGKCPEAIADGQRCKNADGTLRALRHVDVCNQRRADEEARVAAVQQATLKRECGYLQDRVKWAVESGELSLDELVKVIRDYRASIGKCGPYFDASVRTDSGAALCAAGVEDASFPLNLSARSKDELEQLRTQIQNFSSLCKSTLDATQTAGVQGGIQKVDQALSMYR